MLSSLGRFDHFSSVGDEYSSGEHLQSSSRRTQQRVRSKQLGLNTQPVFDRAIQKLQEKGLYPHYTDIRELIQCQPWEKLPWSASPAGGHVPAVR